VGGALEMVSRLIQGFDRLLNLTLSIVLIAILLYAGYALWDSYTVLRKADISDEILYYKPDNSDCSNPSLSELRDINEDVCAWLSIDNTNIDYPVLQGNSNSEYLNISIEKEYSLGGSIFLDYRNNSDFTDRYSLIYGHHMSGGLMFGDISKFSDEDYFSEHRTGWLYVTGKTYQLEIFAFMEVDAYASIMLSIPENDEDLNMLFRSIEDTAKYYDQTEITFDDRVVALSTCTEGTTNGRSILVALMIETQNAGGEAQE
jgi:sortase B